ncbi:MAG: hypothetical protein SFV81_01440 [Pirellulaceae bacterium]|nr:hypothetical protein [Pirellulaceae bacterium]
MFSSPLDAVCQTLILGMIGKECKLLLNTTQWTDSSLPDSVTPVEV